MPNYKATHGGAWLRSARGAVYLHAQTALPDYVDAGQVAELLAAGRIYDDSGEDAPATGVQTYVTVEDGVPIVVWQS